MCDEYATMSKMFGGNLKCHGYSHNSSDGVCRIYTDAINLTTPFLDTLWGGCYAYEGPAYVGPNEDAKNSDWQKLLSAILGPKYALRCKESKRGKQTITINPIVKEFIEREEYTVSFKDGSKQIPFSTSFHIRGVYKWVKESLWKQENGFNYLREDVDNQKWLIGKSESTAESHDDYRSKTQDPAKQDTTWEYYDPNRKEWKEDTNLRVSERLISCESLKGLREAP